VRLTYMCKQQDKDILYALPEVNATSLAGTGNYMEVIEIMELIP